MRISDWSSDVCSSDLALRPSEPFAPFVGVLKLCMEAPLNVKAAINLSDDFQRNGRPCFKLMPTLVGSDTAPDLDRPGLTNRSDEVHALHTAPTLLADRKRTRLNSSHSCASRMPSSALKTQK